MRIAARALALVPALAFLVAYSPEDSWSSAVPSTRTYIEDGPSGRYLMGGKWLHRADPADQGVSESWQLQKDLSGWKSVNVPHAFNAGDESPESLAGSVGWYRKRFRLPDDAAAKSAKEWEFIFQSVNYRATAWLNGRPIGNHTRAYLAFSLPAKKIKRNGLNNLVIRVDSRKGTNDLPGINDVGWWNWGGLLREVYLRRIGRLDARNVVVRPELRCRTCNGRLTVEFTVKNLGNKRRGVVRGTVTGPGGFRKSLEFAKSNVPAKAFRSYKKKLTIKKPRVWSPDHPNLYVVTLSLGPADSPDQTYTVHTGIRSFRKRDDGTLLLNGRPLQLRGASMHEDSPNNGGALTARQRISNVKLLRELNANFTRAHYPLHPQTYELLDRYGIVAWSQIPVYQAAALLIKDKSFKAQALRMLEDNIEQNINHPSIMTWSIANELPSRPGTGQQIYIRQAARLARDLDPTRFVAIDIPGYPTVEPQEIFRELDALGLNDYFGWYRGPHDTLVDRNGLGPYLDQMHAYYPSLGLAVTEFGAEASTNGDAGTKGTYSFQSDFLKFHLDVIKSKPFIAGANIWILKDFRVKPGWLGGNSSELADPPWNQKGVADRYGQKKPSFTEVAKIYKSTPWGRRE